jgi:hypothetical protein
MTLLTGKPARDARDPGRIAAAKKLYGGDGSGLSKPVAHSALSLLYDGKAHAARSNGDTVRAAKIETEHDNFAEGAVRLGMSQPSLQEFAGQLLPFIDSMERTEWAPSDPRGRAAFDARAQARAEARAAAPEHARESLRVKHGADVDRIIADAKVGVAALERFVPGIKGVLEESGAGNDPSIIQHFADVGARFRK